MKEIGGYIEFETYDFPILHEEAIPLNCGRNCLAYLIRAKKIRKIAIPYFLCNGVKNVCMIEKTEIRFYSIGIDLLPLEFTLQKKEWLYIVNYYGQLDNERIKKLSDQYKRVIIDNAQAYFQMPVKNIDTLYTCRKFFGVPDGAFLYTDSVLKEPLPQDESYDRMYSLLGRFERKASEFYHEYLKKEQIFENEPMKQMSRLTMNLLHAIQYDSIKQRRTRNFELLHHGFAAINQLKLKIPQGAFMYPLYISGGMEIRKKLIAQNIYIPVLWPDVSENGCDLDLEYDLAMNLLPLPVDQRYGDEEMEMIIQKIREKYMG